MLQSMGLQSRMRLGDNNNNKIIEEYTQKRIKWEQKCQLTLETKN